MSTTTSVSGLEKFRFGQLPELVAELAAHAPAYDRSGDFPLASVSALHHAGVLTATVGAAYGGDPLGAAESTDLMLGLGEGDPSVALIVAMNLAFHTHQAAVAEVPDALYRRILAESVDGPTLVNALQVEPALGTPSRGGVPATRASRRGDDWILNGHKIYSTGAEGLAWMLVLASTDESPQRVGTFAVRATSEGVGVNRTWDNTGMRASGSHDVVFTDVVVPAEQVFGLRRTDEGPAPRPNHIATLLPAIYLGVAQAARHWFIDFLDGRRPANLDGSLLEQPRFVSALGEIDVALITATELLRSLAGKIDSGEPVGRDVHWAAKTYANRAAIESVSRMSAMIGNPGLSTSKPLERHLRDVYSSRVHFPQEDTVFEALGTAAAQSRTRHEKEK